MPLPSGGSSHAYDSHCALIDRTWADGDIRRRSGRREWLWRWRRWQGWRRRRWRWVVRVRRVRVRRVRVRRVRMMRMTASATAAAVVGAGAVARLTPVEAIAKFAAMCCKGVRYVMCFHKRHLPALGMVFRCRLRPLDVSTIGGVHGAVNGGVLKCVSFLWQRWEKQNARHSGWAFSCIRLLVYSDRVGRRVPMP